LKVFLSQKLRMEFAWNFSNEIRAVRIDEARTGPTGK